VVLGLVNLGAMLQNRFFQSTCSESISKIWWHSVLLESYFTRLLGHFSVLACSHMNGLPQLLSERKKLQCYDLSSYHTTPHIICGMTPSCSLIFFKVTDYPKFCSYIHDTFQMGRCLSRKRTQYSKIPSLLIFCSIS
jgi:hypothetical protein